MPGSRCSSELSQTLQSVGLVLVVEMVRALLCFPLLWSAVPLIVLSALLALIVVEAGTSCSLASLPCR
jgi:hypothetical protein